MRTVELTGERARSVSRIRQLFVRGSAKSETRSTKPALGMKYEMGTVAERVSPVSPD